MNNKVVVIIQGVIATICISIILGYIRMILPFEIRGNATEINKGINKNLFRLVIPLLLAPALEEFIFRKWLPNTFEEVLGRRISIIFSNSIFSLLHLDLFFFPYLANGLIYSWCYEKTNDLKVPIIVHILFNMFVFSITFNRW